MALALENWPKTVISSCRKVDFLRYFQSLLIKTSILIFVKALNQLFEKIMALDIEERHLLRLGHGEEALETEKDFSRFVTIFSTFTPYNCQSYLKF